MKTEKDLFILGIFAGLSMRDEFYKDESKIRSKYSTLLEWECEQANEMYKIYKEKFPEYFNLNKENE